MFPQTCATISTQGRHDHHYFECTAAPVVAEGGEILNFIGDGVLGIFPIAEAEGGLAGAARRATRAVEAALAKCAALQADGSLGGAPLEFGIGLASGELMFGNKACPSGWPSPASAGWATGHSGLRLRPRRWGSRCWPPNRWRRRCPTPRSPRAAAVSTIWRGRWSSTR